MTTVRRPPLNEVQSILEDDRREREARDHDPKAPQVVVVRPDSVVARHYVVRPEDVAAS